MGLPPPQDTRKEDRMELRRTMRGYETVILDVVPDFERNRTKYTVTDMREGHFREGRFDSYEYETPCEAKAKYEELAASLNPAKEEE